MVRDWKALIALLQDGVPAPAGNDAPEEPTASPTPGPGAAEAEPAGSDASAGAATAPADPFAA